MATNDYSHIPEGAGKAPAIEGLENYNKLAQDPNKVYDDSAAKVQKNATVIQALNQAYNNLDPNSATYEQDRLDLEKRMADRAQNIEDYQQQGALSKVAIQEQTGTAERNLATKSLTDPAALINKAQVGNINPAEVGSNVGQAGNYNKVDAATVDNISTADDIMKINAATITPDKVGADVVRVLQNLNPAEKDIRKLIQEVQQDPTKLQALKLGLAQKNNLTERAQGQTMDPNTLAQLNLNAAQTGVTQIGQTPQRTLQSGEMVGGSGVDMNAVDQAVTIDPVTGQPTSKATVQGQMAGLMDDFEGGQTPPWAAGAMRSAQEAMAARGLGASSMAGQAIVQAAMEAAVPLATADAEIQATFERENLNREQQVKVMAAQERAKALGQKFDQEFQSKVINAAKIEGIANQNFTAQQTIAIENAKLANTVNIANLNAKNAKVLADSASLSQVDLANLQNLQATVALNAENMATLDLANLDAKTKKMLSDAQSLTSVELANLQNRQTAQVENAKNFLSMDLANLSNEQQTALFKSQGRMDALMSDQAATNAAKNFNAASENQVNQFFTELASRVQEFNSEQTNLIRKENADSINDMRRVNQTLQTQRDEFNANNLLVVAQANAAWRQATRVEEFAAKQEANMNYARDLNGMTEATLDQLWQKERDLMSYAFAATEGQAERDLRLLLGDKQLAADEATGKGRIAAMLFGGAIDLLKDNDWSLW